MDRLDAMQAFVAVAAQGSFAEAARRLHLSPSAVTRAVASLEARLGQTLIRRTTRSVRLTPQGEGYLEHCRTILQELEAAERQVRGEGAEPRGLLTVAAPVLFGRLHVLPVVTALLKAHPSLSIRLTLSDRLALLVDEGVDVAVRIGALADSALFSTRLGEVERVTVASPAYLESREEPGAPADLAQHDIIGFENVDHNDAWRFGDVAVRVRPRLWVNSAEAALDAAIEGAGITRALSYQADAAIRSGRLRRILEAFGSAPSPVSAVHFERRDASANVAAFVRAAQEAITLPAVP
ncbi:MAG: Transcriptional regulator, LysR family [uncultured Sphingomonadaceae bacterium]|uniref:Transcriptional regulator, LysR family n=1 Tax=uncultured Sphingomonadaceae bacterium TaxID=169976 RepID=A0A6J4SG16_9SPHN|nr:MAG: Transcriptional regulator, LysR family [uncultured Sphingomonadaceae bacterium]